MRRTQVSRSCLAPSLSPKCTSQDGVVCRPRKGGTSAGRLFAQRYGNGCCEKRRQSGQDEEKGGLLGGGIKRRQVPMFQPLIELLRGLRPQRERQNGAMLGVRRYRGNGSGFGQCGSRETKPTGLYVGRNPHCAIVSVSLSRLD